ncbi:MAG: hypothetical protein HQL96_04380 [Magnetococcales bacterium]|nr:hypothetical protein [Magnetococcales bacterium]
MVSAPPPLREEEYRATERSFGLVFAAFFAVIGVWPLWHGQPWRLWAIAAGALFLAVALLKPSLLKPLNRLWGRFGALLHRLVSPAVMAVVFFAVVTPIALLMRMLGKDPLRLKKDPAARSYWIVRDPAGPLPDTMPFQF